MNFVVIPTYNESKNIERLLAGVLGHDCAAIVVDDHSPDGTSEIVARLARSESRVYLAERVSDKGRGTAGIVGFDLALNLGAERIIEMDADFSHPPSEIPRLFRALSEAEIAIASRLSSGSKDLRPASRRLITRFANRYARLFLERPHHLSRVRDWTTGFRAYRRSVFEAVPPASLVSRGPSILQELLFRALNAGFRAVEIPFEMKDRERGQSSFSSRVARQSLLCIPAYRALFDLGPAPSKGAPSEFRLDRYRIEKPLERHFIYTLNK